MSTVTVHLRPHIKEWLIRQYGPSPIEFPRKSVIRDFFQASLSKKFHPSRDYNKKALPETVEIKINKNDVSEHGVAVSLKLQYWLNDQFDAMLNAQLLMFVLCGRVQGDSIAKCIRNYHFMMQFEDRLTERALTERYKRCASSVRNKNFLHIQAQAKRHVPTAA